MQLLTRFTLTFVTTCTLWTTNTTIAQQIHQVSAEVCQYCHAKIYMQWKDSMHANSSALKDPIHATFYEKVVGDPTKEGVQHKASGKFPVCLQCHAPNAARDNTTKLDAKPAYSEGVNCMVCHTLKKYQGIKKADGKMHLGIKAYQLDNALQGPRGFPDGVSKLLSGKDSRAINPHLGSPLVLNDEEIPALPMEANPALMKTSDACMGCHDQRNNSHGVPLCQTGNEYRASGSQVDCQSCHMPVNNGFADHRMGGGYNQSMLKRSVLFTLDSNLAGDVLKTVITLRNQQPHSLPTGAPFRNIYLKLMGYDASGKIIWENAKEHPSEDDPQAYLTYRLVDEKGASAMPPTAVQVGEDSRLKPHEIRTLTYDIPAEGVVLVRGELYYNLLWPMLVNKFKHLPQNLTAPVLIAEAEVTVNDE